ncbi:U32 family peptidase [Candidatus Woesearchaeota archaeon]|nr:U32 family peptidase [Candidatus Woesearchaeota archaeon]
MRKPELLAPVGSIESLQAAIDGGADAVYFGVKELNMRANAKNFEVGQLKKIVKLCHDNNVKAFLTLNTIIYDDELTKAKKVLQEAKNAKVDAIICWDQSIIKLARELGLEIHISTQASIANSQAAIQYEQLGAKRIILARECTLEQIKKIKKNTSVQVEVFVHGAMCVAVSGRCFTSQFLYNRSANRGDCLQPCRREYKIIDLEEDHELILDKGFVMSPKDLCTIEILDKIIDSGVDSLKIEGRMRGPEYTKTVVSAYRKAIDAHAKGKLDKKLKTQLLKQLKTVYNRGLSTGFYNGMPIDEWAGVYGSKATTKKEYIGLVKNFYKKISVAEIKIEAGKLQTGDEMLITGVTTGAHYFTANQLQVDNKTVKTAKKGERVGVKLPFSTRTNDKVFKISKTL